MTDDEKRKRCVVKKTGPKQPNFLTSHRKRTYYILPYMKKNRRTNAKTKRRRYYHKQRFDCVKATMLRSKSPSIDASTSSAQKLPTDVIAYVISPFLNRSSWNNVAGTNKELQKSLKTGITPPWPEIRLDRHCRQIDEMVFSPNGEYFAYSTVYQDVIYLMSRTAGNLGAIRGFHCLNCLEFSSDSDLLAFAHFSAIDGLCISVWSLPMNQVVACMVDRGRNYHPISAMRFVDQSHVAFQCKDARVHLWKIPTTESCLAPEDVMVANQPTRVAMEERLFYLRSKISYSSQTRTLAYASSNPCQILFSDISQSIALDDCNTTTRPVLPSFSFETDQHMNDFELSSSCNRMAVVFNDGTIGIYNMTSFTGNNRPLQMLLYKLPAPSDFHYVTSFSWSWNSTKLALSYTTETKQSKVVMYSHLIDEGCGRPQKSFIQNGRNLVICSTHDNRHFIAYQSLSGIQLQSI